MSLTDTDYGLLNNKGLNGIKSLAALEGALGGNLSSPIKAVLGKDGGGRKFEVAGQEVSLHEIVDKYLSLLKKANLHNSQARLEAGNILEKLQIMKDDHDFLLKQDLNGFVRGENGLAISSLTAGQQVKLGIRKIIGRIFHGSQNDLNRKYISVVKNNLKFSHGTQKRREDIILMMKSVAVDTLLSREIVQIKREVANYLIKIHGGENLVGVKGSSFNEEMNALKNKNYSTEDDLKELIKDCEDLEKTVKRSATPSRKMKASISKSVAEEAIAKITELKELTDVLLAGRQDVKNLNKKIDINNYPVEKDKKVEKKVEKKKEVVETFTNHYNFNFPTNQKKPQDIY